MTTQEEPCALAISVGQKMRKARRERGMRLKHMAIACHTSAQTICRLETATMTMSLDWLEKMAKALDLPPAYFLSDGVE